MKVTKVDSVSVFQNPHEVEAKKIYENEKASVIHMSLTLGQSLRKHTAPNDVFVYILEGKGIVEIDDEKQEVGKNTIIEIPKGSLHLLKNTSKQVFKFLAVKLT